MNIKKHTVVSYYCSKKDKYVFWRKEYALVQGIPIFSGIKCSGQSECKEQSCEVFSMRD
ncbi:MAG: hypothetical protein IJO14_05205 [Clostridia bacterium]|nr:hypothetical protein [Clostridia bacterium]